jgi:inosine triphosphate pyrophosphatase
VKIIFITGNKDKFEEAKAVIPDLIQEDIDLPEIQNIDSRKVIEEKLKEAKKKVKGNIIVEDVSLSLDALNGLPGPLIKWFLKTIGNVGLVKIARSFDNFNATVKVTIGLLEESGDESYFEGEAKGKIVESRGKNGFAWDPILELREW